MEVTAVSAEWLKRLSLLFLATLPSCTWGYHDQNELDSTDLSVSHVISTCVVKISAVSLRTIERQISKTLKSSAGDFDLDLGEKKVISICF